MKITRQVFIDAFISPLVIDEVSYVLMVQTARRTGGPPDARSMKRSMLQAWQDCLVPVHEFHDYLDVLISKGHLRVLSLDYSISKIARWNAPENTVFFPGMLCIPPAARHLG